MVTPIDIPHLAAAFELERGELVSIVGGGGKTTTLFALGEQLAGTTVLTTTTKMGKDRTGGLPVLYGPTDKQLVAALADDPAVLAWHEVDDHRATGVAPETVDRWFGLADNVVVEADGSRRQPFKAPLDYEPVVASRTTMLVACLGVAAIGAPIRERCQRPERVAAIANCSVDDVLTPARAAAVLLSDDGSMKAKPSDARFAVCICRVEPEDLPIVDQLAGAVGPDVAVIAVNAYG